MTSITRSTIVRGALAAAALVTAVAWPAAAQADGSEPLAFAITDNERVLTFELDEPRDGRSRRITGLAAGDRIVGADERPKTGELYAVAMTTAGTGRAYTIDPATGAAKLAFDLRNATGGAPILLQGTQFGVDFNPMADALRIVGDGGQNLRALPSDRVTQPGGVARAAGDTFVDGTLSYSPVAAVPRAPAQGIQAAAYTNNVAGATATTLYDVDADRRELVVQAPPNDGTLTKAADLRLGGRTVGGFDIRTVGTENTAYAVLGGEGGVHLGSRLDDLLHTYGLRLRAPSRLVRVDLATGAITPVGRLESRSPIVGFAVDVPAP